jgi:RND family efflux transporter MFP subunit
VLPVFSLFLLGGCAEEPPDKAVDVARPIKTLVALAPTAVGGRKFPARIDAAQKAELSFRVPGKVQQLDVKLGDPVRAGQVLAKLDTTDFEIIVADRQVVFNKTRKDYLSGKVLVNKGHISRTDFDRMVSEFKSAGAALRQAKQDLVYTELKAPFDGLLAKRHIERFEEVQTKQPIFSVRATKTLEFIFDVPEDLLKLLNLDADPPVYATFGSKPGERFPLIFKDMAARADPDTQTFEARYTMPARQGVTLLPGITATVIADFRQFADNERDV